MLTVCGRTIGFYLLCASALLGQTPNAGQGGGASTNPPSALPASTTYVFPSRGKMNRYWLQNTIGPKALVGAAFTASWKTWDNRPREWHGNASGWSKRFGSSLLDNGINHSVLMMWSRAVRQDPIYYRCECSTVWPRVNHAFKLVFESRKPDGEYAFAPAKLASPFAGPMVTRNTIYPHRYDAGDAALGGAYYLLGGFGWNVFREFVWNKIW